MTLFDEHPSESKIPVITLYQPWATWIMRGWKTIETRTHSRFASLVHRTVLIHAGQKTDDSDFAIRNPYLTPEQIRHEPNEMINGAILGSVYVDAVGWLCGDYCENSAALIESTNRYGLFLKDIKKFPTPIYVKGSMGIWYFDVERSIKI